MIKVSKIVIDLNGKEIELPYESAKELYQALKPVFGKRAKFNNPYPFSYPDTAPWYPTCGSGQVTNDIYKVKIGSHIDKTV